LSKLPVRNSAGVTTPKLEASATLGAFIAPSVYRDEPAFFVRNGEMATGVKIDKYFCDKEIKKFIFLDFCFYPPAFFVSNGEMAMFLNHELTPINTKIYIFTDQGWRPGRLVAGGMSVITCRAMVE